MGDTNGIRYLLFDLDDTLYPRRAGVMDEIRRLMVGFLCTQLSLSPEEADALRGHYFRTYGTTMRGLQLNYQIDADEYMRIVHDIPLHQYLQANTRLDEVLASLPQTKIVFTNASREHAENVLAVLGIRHHFQRIVDVRDMAYESKPQPAAYQRICDMIGAQPDECLIVEDNVRNLQPAKALGMVTVLVPHDPELPEHDESVDYVISTIEEIGGVMAELADGGRDRFD